MWSVHRALTCRLLFSCPAEHLITETPLPVSFSLHAPRSPHFKKKHFFLFFPRSFSRHFGPPNGPTLGPPKNAKIIFQGDFWGPKGLPPRDRPSCRFPKKLSNASSGRPFFSEGGGVRCSPRVGAFWDPKKIKKMGASNLAPFGTSKNHPKK